MADWRALHKRVCTDPRIVRCSEWAQLLHTRLLCQADDFGRLDGDPLSVKLLCVPASSRNFLEIAAGLLELQAASIIDWYVVADGSVVQLQDFDEEQPKVLIGKRTKPKHPERLPESRSVASSDFQEFPGISSPDRDRDRDRDREGGREAAPSTTHARASARTHAREATAAAGPPPGLWERFQAAVGDLRGQSMTVGMGAGTEQDLARVVDAYPQIDHRAVIAEWSTYWASRHRARQNVSIIDAAASYQRACDLAVKRQAEEATHGRPRTNGRQGAATTERAARRTAAVGYSSTGDWIDEL